jgi:hypothetical protein
MRLTPPSRSLSLPLALAAALLACGDREPTHDDPREAARRIVAGINEGDPDAILQHVDSDFRGGRVGREPDLDYGAAQAVALELAMREEPLSARLDELRVVEEGPDERSVEARVWFDPSDALADPRAARPASAIAYRFEIRMRRREGTWQATSLVYEPL